MDNKIVVISIAAVIGIIVLGSVLMPIMNDATATTDTFTNKGYERAEKVTDESTTVIVWTPSVDPNTITINGEPYDLAPFQTINNISYSIIFSDDFIIRYFYTTSSQEISLWSAGYRGGIGSTSANTGTFTVDSTSATFSSTQAGHVPITVSHSGDYFRINPNGEYIIKDRNSTAYVLKDSTIIYAGGLSYIDSTTSSGFYFEGTIDHYTFTPMATTVVVSNPETAYTDVDGYVGLVSVEKITFDTTYTPQSGDPVERSQTYSYFLVPYEVDAERSIHFTPGQNAIFAAMPVMIILAILLGVVALVIRSRMD